MTTPFLERLRAGRPLVADGATGTSYQEMGSEIGVAPEEWVYDRPEAVMALHRAFIAAGSDIILTDTFGGTPLRMRESKYADRALPLNRRAAELAREVTDGHPGVLIAGSMGPTGVLMEPYGELTHDAAVQTFADQAAALTSGGVDLLVLETFFALEEALAAVEGVRRVSDRPLVVSFSFDQGTRTMMGLSPTQMVKAIQPLKVTAIGANCGKSLQAMEAVTAEIAGLKAGIPLWVKPNAGLPRMDGDLARYDTGPDTMAEYTTRFLALGAQIVGGCCGTSPSHVAAIAAVARADRPVRPVEAPAL
ncbi:MAG TPA: homocysteine S-methyltransferase family protein [Candidatus Dormibacteraeota bacterium]|jgi:5-methyltetrahydrofolate--homocysteine methyltransferase